MQRDDRKLMMMAIDEARKQAERYGIRGTDPLVGCVIRTKEGNVVGGYRGEEVHGYHGKQSSGDHAEYTVLHKKMESDILAGATLYTTLEPCIKRSPEKVPCADRIIERQIGRVVIGYMDPDEKGQGYHKLIEAGIDVSVTTSDLVKMIRELNRNFISSRKVTSSKQAGSNASKEITGTDEKIHDSEPISKNRSKGHDIVHLTGSQIIKDALKYYPNEYRVGWRNYCIDGAIELFHCPKPNHPYGGWGRDRIICEVSDDIEWPDYLGSSLSPEQVSALELGLIGRSGQGFNGWLMDKSRYPGRVRTLRMPPKALHSGRPDLHLRFANSDYFTLRTIAELSRIDRKHHTNLLYRAFPERWAPSESEFSIQCVPYHVSAQAIIVCIDDKNALHLLISSVNPMGPAITDGWVVTMAEQMSAKVPGADVPRRWWSDAARTNIIPVPEDKNVRDDHINDTLLRGLWEELAILPQDLFQEPLLLCGAIEQDMYAIPFIYVVFVKESPMKVFEKWRYLAEDRSEIGSIASYQLTGTTENGEYLSGPDRLAKMIACEQFDVGPILLPTPLTDANFISWHFTSRYRIFSLGMHLWPEAFSKLVRIL